MRFQSLKIWIIKGTMALQDENGKITVRITEKDDAYPGEIETGFFSLNKEEARRFIDKLEASAKECWGES